MFGAVSTGVRQIIGGPNGNVVGVGGLSSAAGSTLSPLPNWMRGATSGCFAGWFTVNSVIPNLCRLFELNDGTETNRFDCYIEPDSDRWQLRMITGGVQRAVVFVLIPDPSPGATVGFAISWRGDRISGAIGSSGVFSAAYTSALPACSSFTIGDRPAIDRTLPATFRALEWFNNYIPESYLSFLATRTLPSAARLSGGDFFSLREDSFKKSREESDFILREE